MYRISVKHILSLSVFFFFFFYKIRRVTNLIAKLGTRTGKKENSAILMFSTVLFSIIPCCF